jgi:hypothetical protein
VPRITTHIRDANGRLVTAEEAQRQWDEAQKAREERQAKQGSAAPSGGMGGSDAR